MRNFRSLFLRISLILLSCVLVNGNHAIALDIHWNGSGGPFGNPGSWQNVDNWDPAGSPFQVHRVPGDGDTATLTSPSSDQVRLFANSAPINGLTVSNGISLSTNGFLLSVDNGGFAGTATTAIAGNAQLVVDDRPSGSALVTDNLLLSGGGKLLLNGGDAIVEGNTTLLSGSTITDDILPMPTGGGITFGGDLTMVESTMVLNAGTGANFVGGGTVSARESSSIELTQDLVIDNGALFEIHTGSALTVDGQTTIGANGTLEILGATFNSDAVLVDGGTMRVTDDQFAGNFVLPVGGTFTARNGGQLLLESSHDILNDQVYTIESGADVAAANTSVFVGGPGGGGELFVDGVGSTLDVRQLDIGASSPGLAQVTYRNGASGTLNSLRVNAGFTPSNPNPVRASVLIETNASVQTSSLLVGRSGGPPGSFGDLSVRSGGTLTQTGGGGARIGTDAFSQGFVTVSDGGTYSSSTGSFDIRARGQLIVHGGAETGVVEINGPLDVGGQIFVQATSGMPNDPGGMLHVNAPMTINGGEVNLSGGVMTVDSISFANAGVFNFTGGWLSVGVYTGNLTNAGGTLAPGSSAGDTTIVGNYTQQANGALELEIGGTGMGTQYDFVDVSGNAVVDGELELALIDGFIPSEAQLFTVFNAGNLLGIFDNIANGGRLGTLNGGGSFKVNYGVASAFNPDQIVLSNFLPASADTEPDGDVDGADFLAIQRTNPALIPLWESQFGIGAPLEASQAIPEPQSLALLLLALTCVSRRYLVVQHDIN